MNEVTIEKSPKGSYVVRGPLRFDTVPQLWRQAQALFQDASRLVLDLGGVTRSDSAGLALLIEWLREARRRNIHMHFRNIPDQMQAIARLSHLDHLL